MGPCPVLPTCRTAYVTGQWRGGKQVQLGPVVRPSLSPSLSPGDQLHSLAPALGQILYHLLRGSCTRFHPCTCGVTPLSPLLR